MPLASPVADLICIDHPSRKRGLQSRGGRIRRSSPKRQHRRPPSRGPVLPDGFCDFLYHTAAPAIVDFQCTDPVDGGNKTAVTAPDRRWGRTAALG
jgi:hypothetical protein